MELLWQFREIQAMKSKKNEILTVFKTKDSVRRPW